MLFISSCHAESLRSNVTLCLPTMLQSFMSLSELFERFGARIIYYMVIVIAEIRWLEITENPMF